MTLEDENAVLVKQVRQLTFKLEVREGDLCKKEVGREEEL